MNFFFSVIIKSFDLFYTLKGWIVMNDFVTLCINHLENIGSLSYTELQRDN